MAKKKVNYKIDGKCVIAKIAELTEEELSAVKNYIALGFELKEPEKKPGIKVSEMREELKADAEALKKFNELYKIKADKEKGIKPGFYQACIFFNAWKKKNKSK